MGAPAGAAFRRPFPRSFYERPTLRVARELLGALLLRRFGSRVLAARIVETEAYRSDDPASHAFRGLTARNRSMFEGPGTLYVYRIHQVHCANAVTRRGEAVLFRAAEPLSEWLGDLSGPGRLCRGLMIDASLDGVSLVDSEIRVSPGPPRREQVVVGRRVGIRKAVERPWRFALEGNENVSRPRPR